MASALSDKGYVGATIADVVHHAGVSKRTFYEHFADKEECFLACYVAMSEIASQALEHGAKSPARGCGKDPIRGATTAYVKLLESQPALTQALLMGILATGPSGLRMRREVMARFAKTLRKLATRERREKPKMRSLSAPMAMAIVGGVHELTLLAIEQGRAGHLADVGHAAAELVRAVLLGT
ncbi:MAG: TetR/AcrR family transcriptional regulator [Polyangiaceae bacterium]|nr:TetR/AcrR family transcriptional regulator [Polyangiaceae bacterium]